MTLHCHCRRAGSPGQGRGFGTLGALGTCLATCSLWADRQWVWVLFSGPRRPAEPGVAGRLLETRPRVAPWDSESAEARSGTPISEDRSLGRTAVSFTAPAVTDSTPPVGLGRALLGRVSIEYNRT